MQCSSISQIHRQSWNGPGKHSINYNLSSSWWKRKLEERETGQRSTNSSKSLNWKNYNWWGTPQSQHPPRVPATTISQHTFLNLFFSHHLSFLLTFPLVCCRLHQWPQNQSLLLFLLPLHRIVEKNLAFTYNSICYFRMSAVCLPYPTE